MVVWKLHSLDARIASVRYRAILPVLALQSSGVASRLCRALGVKRSMHAEVVVFVKSVTVKDLILAQQIHRLGIPIVLDLCDNIFVPNYMRKFPVSPAEIFEAMAQYATVITTTGPSLAQVIRRRIGFRAPIVIIPDGIETHNTIAEGNSLLARARVMDLGRRAVSVGFWVRGGLKVLEKVPQVFVLVKGFQSRGIASIRHRIKAITDRRGRVVRTPLQPRAEGRARQQSAKTIIWFGNAGADYGKFGLRDIVDIASHLVRAHARVKFELLVVSNDEDAYRKLIQPLPFPSRYLPWNPATIQAHIKSSDLAIVPNSMDDFAVCKSSNRAVLALSLGIPVVATQTPALEVLQRCVVLDDWENGIVRYLSDPVFVRAHLDTASVLLRKEFSNTVLAERWSQAIALARACRERQAQEVLPQRRIALVVVLHLIQDLDLAVPVLREGMARSDIAIRAWISKSLLEKSPRVLRTLRAMDVPFDVVADDSVLDLRALEFEGVGAILSIAETNQRAHRIPHRITKRANAAGIPTYTMQHGFENIGLTYTDSVHPIEDVRFAARTIFTWGPSTFLHPQVREDTKAKCKSVGCTKETTVVPVNIESIRNAHRVIGIFENLHWHRYDCSYVDRFLADCLTVADSYPELTFLVKPHHAGQWLTSRYHGPVPVRANLVIADPADPLWESYTAGQLLGRIGAVITSPSTVALDAARMGKPVAVVGYGLDLSLYSPLPILGDGKQWGEFIQQIANPISRQFLVGRSQAFVNKALCQGNAVARLLDVIVQDHQTGSLGSTKETARPTLPHVG